MLLAAVPAHAEPLVLAWPSAGDDGGWEIEEFEGETRYRVVRTDGRRVLEADSDATASSLYLEREIDIGATPILEWSWRIEKPLAVDDERVKAGDDFAARVYVVASGEGMFALPRAISYVWANRAEVGESWPNPFTSKVMMVAMDTAEAEAGTWRTHRRDVRGRLPPPVRHGGRRARRHRGHDRYRQLRAERPRVVRGDGVPPRIGRSGSAKARGRGRYHLWL